MRLEQETGPHSTSTAINAQNQRMPKSVSDMRNAPEMYERCLKRAMIKAGMRYNKEKTVTINA